MSRLESGFIPLPKVEQEQPLDNVFFNFNLPQFVDQDRIGVNLSRIEKINRLSGIAVFAVKGRTDLDQSSEEHNVVGIAPDGSALASKSKTKNMVPAIDLFAKSEFNPFFHSDSRSVALAMNLNINEITSRIQLSNGNVRESEDWSKEIDRVLRETLRKEGTENLVKLNNLEKFFLPISYGIVPAAIFGIMGSFPMVYYSVVYSIDKIRAISRHRSWSETRLSIFPSVAPQLDRAALLQFRTRTQKLVADIPTEVKK